MDRKSNPLQRAIADAILGMTPEDLTRHPEGKWSTAEILEHLNLTYIGTVKGLGRCITSGETTASPDRSAKRLQRITVTKLGYFPNGRKSPERVLPRGLPAEQVKAEILENVARMQALIDECEARFGKRKPIADHPILGPLTAPEWRKFHLVHGRHHVKQILRLKNGA